MNNNSSLCCARLSVFIVGSHVLLLSPNHFLMLPFRDTKRQLCDGIMKEVGSLSRREE